MKRKNNNSNIEWHIMSFRPTLCGSNQFRFIFNIYIFFILDHKENIKLRNIEIFWQIFHFFPRLLHLLSLFLSISLCLSQHNHLCFFSTNELIKILFNCIQQNIYINIFYNACPFRVRGAVWYIFHNKVRFGFENLFRRFTLLSSS